MAESSPVCRDHAAHVFGAAEAVFILSSMHLATASARLSRLLSAWPFSVFIQHSEAARVRVIGGSGLAASALGAPSPANGPGPLPSVSQPANLYASLSVFYARQALAGVTYTAGQKTDHNSTIIALLGNLEDAVPAPLVDKSNVDDPTLWGNAH